MARTRLHSDSEIFATVLNTLESAGEKALTFGQIAKRAGMAPATLAQRFGSVEGMIRAALLAEWARLVDAVDAADAETLASAKGAQALLKQLQVPSPEVLTLSFRDQKLAEAAEVWRTKVETALAQRRGGGAKGKDSAALIFSAWQGRAIWEGAGGKSFRLAELLKALP